MPILEMRILRLREAIYYLACSHIAIKWKTWDLKPTIWVHQPCF